jgi:hypothetical protein
MSNYTALPGHNAELIVLPHCQAAHQQIRKVVLLKKDDPSSLYLTFFRLVKLKSFENLILTPLLKQVS